MYDDVILPMKMTPKKKTAPFQTKMGQFLQIKQNRWFGSLVSFFSLINFDDGGK